MKTTAKFAILFFLACYSISCAAQGYAISGKVTDKKDASPLISVSVLAVNTADTSQKNGGVTDIDGNFSIAGFAAGNYKITFNYLGYKSLERIVAVSDKDVPLGSMQMESVTKELKSVTVKDKQVRAQQKGDTSQFNADAYKTNPDATGEDLVSKMPGITSDNTGVKVNGESVQQILVDGKPFFGNDPSLAIKNLPAEVIDKIQIFDKLSDQAQFTGFDDGNSQKTMNIITRRNKSEGVFGKVYAGYGTDDRYIAGGNLNIFKGDRRISILGLSNNVNQQNFSTEDILGAVGSSGQNRGGGRGGPGRGGSGGNSGGNPANNFIVGQQGGIAATSAFGLNYSDNWGKKVKISGSYFFNNMDNISRSGLTRDYFSSKESVTNYTENNTSEAVNTNHRFNARLEYTIDTSNSITFTPSLSLQQYNATSSSNATNSIGGVLQSVTTNNNPADNTGYNSSGNLLYQHKFGKPRRTLSFNVNAAVNEKSGDGGNYSSNQFYDTVTVSTVRDQRYDLYNNGTTLSTNLSYTEPIGEKGQLQFSYNPSYSESSSDKETYSKNLAGEYANRDTLFSNKYSNTYITQKGGINYRVGDQKGHFNIGANVQQATLDGRQEFPNPFHLERKFTNVLPNASYNFRYADGRNLRVMYRTNTNVPSVTQLQNVIDISNPLLLRTGNLGLAQAFEQTFIVRYGITKAKSGKNFFLNVYANNTSDYIGTATYIPTKDSLFADTVTNTVIGIRRGSQLSRPVNLDGYWAARFFITYGMPIGVIKSNLNVNGGFNFTRTPGQINSLTNYASNYVPNFGIVLGSNISEKLDFTLSYSGNYNIVNNTIQAQANNNYYNHAATFRINWIFLENFVLNTNITNNYYTAFSGSGDQSFYLWGAYLGYKFFKKSLEARVSVYDILNQNTSISRTVTETYIENTNTQVLKQYFMFQLTYTIRKFKGGAKMPDVEKPDETQPPWGDMRRRNQ